MRMWTTSKDSPALAFAQFKLLPVALCSVNGSHITIQPAKYVLPNLLAEKTQQPVPAWIDAEFFLWFGGPQSFIHWSHSTLQREETVLTAVNHEDWGSDPRRMIERIDGAQLL